MVRIFPFALSLSKGFDKLSPNGVVSSVSNSLQNPKG
jgi:hypothetical protein